MIDLAELPSQPPNEVGETAPPIEGAPTPEQVAAATAAVWASTTDEQKQVHIQSLIVSCVDSIYRNNPVLWIYVPAGATQEFSRIWIERMTQQLGGNIDPNNPTTQLYFPDIKEDPQVAVPSLYTKELKVGNDLLQFTRELAALGEVDLVNLHNQVGLDVASMKGLLLFWRIGMPAMLKKMENQAAAAGAGAPGPRVTPGGILLPNG